MKFTINSTENDVLEYLQQRYAHLDDVSARSIIDSEGYLRTRRKGKQRSHDGVDHFVTVAQRPEGTSIDDAFEALLSDDDNENSDSKKRTYFRQAKRAHKLLDPRHTYNEDDFCDAILAKQFDVAAAIFKTSGEQTKRKIVVFLNRYYRHFQP